MYKNNSFYHLGQEQFQSDNIGTLNQSDLNIIDLKSRKYVIKKIYDGDCIYKRYVRMLSSIISNKKQYLVYNINNVLHIHDIRLNKSIQKLQQNCQQSSFQFSSASQLLFVGYDDGLVYGFRTSNNFKQIFKQQIHHGMITNIIIIQNYLLTSSEDETIIKTDYINKQQQFQLIGHSKSIQSIDYDELKDIIMSGSHDKTIIIWDCKKQSILIEHYCQDSIIQAQLIDNKENIISLDYQSKLFKWKIDYQNLQLVKLMEYKDIKRISSFQSINNDQNLLIICDKYCKILNSEGELINMIKHDLYIDISYPLKMSYRQQLDNLSYIIIQNHESAHLAVAQN